MKIIKYIIFSFNIIIWSCQPTKNEENKTIFNNSDSGQLMNYKLPYQSIIPNENKIIDVDSFYNCPREIWTYAVVLETNKVIDEFLPEYTIYNRELWIINRNKSDSIPKLTFQSTGLIEPKNIISYGPGFNGLSFDSTGLLVVKHFEYTGSHDEDIESSEMYSVEDSMFMQSRNFIYTTKRDYSDSLGWKFTKEEFKYNVIENKLSLRTSISRSGGQIIDDTIEYQSDTVMIPGLIQKELLLIPLDLEGFRMGYR